MMGSWRRHVYVVMHICATFLIHTFPAPQTTKLIISNIFLLTYINYSIYEINIFLYAYIELDNVLYHTLPFPPPISIFCPLRIFLLLVVIFSSFWYWKELLYHLLPMSMWKIFFLKISLQPNSKLCCELGTEGHRLL